MIHVNIKPLSVNEAWKGRRFRSDKYKAYELEAWIKLPRTLEIPEGPLQITLVFGQSNAAADFDNPVKPFVDILQKKYKFNDKRIRRCKIDVRQAPLGGEYILFKLEALN